MKTPPKQSDAPCVGSSEMVRSQRAMDIENLRITIKVLEREDREIELETARFFLREMKNKERQPQTPNAPGERPATGDTR
jgi:hypothetical protein